MLDHYPFLKAIPYAFINFVKGPVIESIDYFKALYQ